MKHLLSTLLLSGVVGLSSFNAMAQSEEFKGYSGKTYFADYEAGLVFQLENSTTNYATMVSPVDVVDNEFRPLWEDLVALDNRNEALGERIIQANDLFESVLSAIQTNNEQYEIMTENFKNEAQRMLLAYMDLAEKLEDLQNSLRAPGRKGAATRGTTLFTFWIDMMWLNHDLADVYVDLTESALLDYLDEIQDLANEAEEASVELEDIGNMYLDVLQAHLNYYESLCAWLEENDQYLTADDIDEIGMDIQDMVEDLRIEIEYIPSNPQDYLTTWIESCREAMQKTYDYYVDAHDCITEAATDLSTIILNFSGVLFAGANGEEFGLYYNIKENDYTLELPVNITSDSQEYRVVGANGNIFSCIPADFTMSDFTLAMPSTIRQIRNGAFATNGIKTVYVPTSEVPSMDADCFTERVYSTATLYVTDGWVASYQAREPWKNFYQILPLSSAGVEEVAAGEVNVKVEGGKVIVEGEVPVAVYNVSGKEIYSGKASVVELPGRGIYVVKAGDKAIKVVY